MEGMKKYLSLSILVYIIWVTVTYFLEGRIHTLLRPEASFDRAIYAIVANLLVGIIIAAVIIRSSLKSGAVTLPQLGFRSIKRTIAAVIVAGIIGSLYFILQGSPSSNPVVILNVYSQVMVVSVAEIVVCWAVLGTIFESVIKEKSKLASIVVGIIVASFSFGFYHYAHSPPFNTLNMVLFMSLIGVITSLVYFLGRDIYATIVFHNFMGTLGVMQAADLTALTEPAYPLIIMAIISLLILIGVHITLSRSIDILS
jgi:membrane protease YdiL (CAAX protease family)